MQLHERFRPTTWAELVGQDRVKRQVDAVRKSSGLRGQNWNIRGKSGTGKTSIARLLGAELAGKTGCVIEVHASKVRADWLDDIERMTYHKPWDPADCYVLIVNESHYLSRLAVGRLLDLLETGKEYVVWIFTTTIEGGKLFDDGGDAKPFLSRCHEISTSDADVGAVALRLKRAAMDAGLDGRDTLAYVKLLAGCEGNIRAAYQQIEQGAMAGK